MHTAYISLGSNMGDREQNLLKVLKALNRHRKIQVRRQSNIFETEPFNCAPDCPWFLNNVLEITTDLTAKELMDYFQEIEKKIGKKKAGYNLSRLIDIDIIFYDFEIIKLQNLKVPHPRYRKRGFVLIPMAELAPDLHDPETCKTIKETLNELKTDLSVNKYHCN